MKDPWKVLKYKDGDWDTEEVVMFWTPSKFNCPVEREAIHGRLLEK